MAQLNKSGGCYEHAVFIYSLFNNENKNFDIGKEIKFCDKWDDLVVKVNEDKFKYYNLLQSKVTNNSNNQKKCIDSEVLLGKKEPPISLKKDDFDLKKYFISYLRIRDQLKSRNNDNNSVGNNDDNSEIQKLIIFTDACLDEDDLKQNVGDIEQERNENDIILNTNKDFIFYKIKPNMTSPFIQEIKKNFKSDFDILAESLAKCAKVVKEGVDLRNIDMDRKNKNIPYYYYRSALIKEKIIKVESIKNVKKGKFTEDFLKGRDLSDRAQKLKEKFKQCMKGALNENELEKAEWRVSYDFDLGETDESIRFSNINLPNSDISIDINDEINEFFKILEFRTNQLGVDKILKRTKNKDIKNKFSEQHYDLDYLQYIIQKFIEDWKNDKLAKVDKRVKERWFLFQEISDGKIITELKTKFSKPKTQYITEENVEYLEKIIEKYDLNYINDYSFDFENSNNMFIFIKTTSIVLSSVKMLAFLTKINYKNYLFFIDLKNQLNDIIKLIDAFRDGKFSLLILSFDFSKDDNIIEQLFDKLSTITQNHSDKKIIFISLLAKNSLIKKFQKFNGYAEYNDKELGFQYLKDVSKIYEQEITVQDQLMNLRDFIENRENDEQMDVLILDRFIKNPEIKISKKPLGISEVEGAYTELIQEVDMEAFVNELSQSNDIYIISGIYASNKKEALLNDLKEGISRVTDIESQIEIFNKQDIKKHINNRIKVSDYEFKEQDFKKICQINEERKIYWVKRKFQSGVYELQQIYNPHFYLEDKRFNNEVVIEKDVKTLLKSDKLSETFIFCVKDENKFKRWLEFTDYEEKKFEENFDNEKILFANSLGNGEEMFQRQDEQNPIHLVKFENTDLIWCKTQGSLENLSKYRALNHKNIKPLIDEKVLLEEILHEKAVIIAGDPGMGKSTTLVKLYTKESIIKSHWLVKVTLKDHLKAIRKINFNNVNITKEITKFLSEVDKSLNIGLDNIYYSREEHLLFTRSLLNVALLKENFNKPLLIIFDGFDEVLDEADRDKVILLLECLKDKTKAKFWITTHLHYEQILEEKLSIFAIRFDSMSKEMIRIFIENYLKNSTSLILKHNEFKSIFGNNDDVIKITRLETYIELFLKKMQEVFEGDISKFIGTPLQLYLMLVGSTEHFIEWVGINNVQCPDFSYLGDDTCEVYENFIQRKYNIYFKKAEVEEHLRQEEDKTIIDRYHKNLARSLILKTECKNSLEKFKDMVLLVGITKPHDGNITFIHPSFTEYLAAKLFTNWLTKPFNELSNLIKTEYVLKEIFVKQDYGTIRHFMNMKLKNILNTEENLKQCGDVMCKLWGEKSKSLINTFDQTILHISISEGNENLMKVILNIVTSKLNRNQLINFLTHPNILYIINCNSRTENAFELILLKLSSQQLFDLLTHPDNEDGSTILHNFMNRINYYHLYIEIATLNLTSEQLRDALMCRNKEGQPALHFITLEKHDYKDLKLLEIIMGKVAPTLSSEQLLDLLKYYNGVILFTLKDGFHGFELILYKTISTLPKQKLLDILNYHDKDRKTVLHYICDKDPRIINYFLKKVKSRLSPEQFFDLIAYKDHENKTFLHRINLFKISAISKNKVKKLLCKMAEDKNRPDLIKLFDIHNLEN